MKYVKLIFRLLLGAFMTYAGFSHLTFNRQEFVAQVPTWLQFSPTKKRPLIHCESAAFSNIGGRGDRTRTCDSLVPNQERYQLRYTSIALKAGAKVLRKIEKLKD